MRRILHLGLTQGNYFPKDLVTHSPILELKPNYISAEIIDSLKEYDFVIVTSKATVNFFLKQHVINFKRSVQYISIGSETTKALQRQGLLTAYTSTNPSQEGLVDLLKTVDLNGKKFLLPRSNLARTYIDQFFKENQVCYRVIEVYETQLKKDFQKKSLEDFDALFFSSSSCVDFFFKFYCIIPNSLTIIAMGKPTLETLIKYNKEYLNRVELVLN